MPFAEYPREDVLAEFIEVGLQTQRTRAGVGYLTIHPHAPVPWPVPGRYIAKPPGPSSSDRGAS